MFGGARKSGSYEWKKRSGNDIDPLSHRRKHMEFLDSSKIAELYDPFRPVSRRLETQPTPCPAEEQ